MDRGLSFTGAVMIVIGIVCLLQSTGLLPDSVMRGDMLWTGVGIVVLLVGLILCFLGLRISKGTREH